MNALSHRPSIQNAVLLSVRQLREAESIMDLEFDRPVRVTTAPVDLQVLIAEGPVSGEICLDQISTTLLRLSGAGLDVCVGGPAAVFIPENCRCLAVLDGGKVQASARLVYLV